MDRVIGFVLLTWPGLVQAQEWRLVLEGRDGGPAVVAAATHGDAVDRAFRPTEPQAYECVVSLNVVDPAGRSLLTQSPTADAHEWSVFVYPEGRPVEKRSPRKVAVVQGVEGPRLLVAWRPENSRAPYVVQIDATRGGDTLRLATPPFVIPDDALVLCGRIPNVHLGLMLPAHDGRGFNVDFSLIVRRGWRGSCVQTVDTTDLSNGPAGTVEHCFLSGLIELRGEGSKATAPSSTLLDAMSLGGRFSVRAMGGPAWVSVGFGARAEATERLDVVNGAAIVSIEARLDFIRPDNVQTFWRRFTPYPTLTVEYGRLFKVRSGSGGVNGHSPADRLRLRYRWAVPMLLNTTLHLDLRADYFVTGLAAEEFALKPFVDVMLRYPINHPGTVGLIARYMGGSAPPRYVPGHHLLAGLILNP